MPPTLRPTGLYLYIGQWLRLVGSNTQEDLSPIELVWPKLVHVKLHFFWLTHGEEAAAQSTNIVNNTLEQEVVSNVEVEDTILLCRRQELRNLLRASSFQCLQADGLELGNGRYSFTGHFLDGGCLRVWDFRSRNISNLWDTEYSYC